MTELPDDELVPVPTWDEWVATQIAQNESERVGSVLPNPAEELEVRTDDELREIHAAAADRLENDPEGNNRVDAQLAQYAAWVLAQRGIDV